MEDYEVGGRSKVSTDNSQGDGADQGPAVPPAAEGTQEDWVGHGEAARPARGDREGVRVGHGKGRGVPVGRDGPAPEPASGHRQRATATGEQPPERAEPVSAEGGPANASDVQRVPAGASQRATATGEQPPERAEPVSAEGGPANASDVQRVPAGASQRATATGEQPPKRAQPVSAQGAPANSDGVQRVSPAASQSATVTGEQPTRHAEPVSAQGAPANTADVQRVPAGASRHADAVPLAAIDAHRAAAADSRPAVAVLLSAASDAHRVPAVASQPAGAVQVVGSEARRALTGESRASGAADTRMFVVVTRAEADNGPLSSQLRELGLTVLLWPAVSVAVAETSALEEALENIHAFDWIVFASRHAVAAVIERVEAPPPNLRVAAVGQATGQVLRQRGWPVDLLPEDASAAALVSEFATKPMQDTKVLFPASSRALPTIAAGLSQLGATVTQVEAYRTEPASLDVDACRAWIERGVIAAVTFASPSAVIELEHSLAKPHFDRLLKSARVIAIGPTTARALEEHGCTPIIAETANLSGLAETTFRSLQTRD